MGKALSVLLEGHSGGTLGDGVGWCARRRCACQVEGTGCARVPVAGNDRCLVQKGEAGEATYVGRWRGYNGAVRGTGWWRMTIAKRCVENKTKRTMP